MAGDWVAYQGDGYTFVATQREMFEDSETELYRHYDADGKLLYVGISLSAVIRLAAHKQTSEWFNRIVQIKIERFSNRRAALIAERTAILAENPEFNTLGMTKDDENAESDAVARFSVSAAASNLKH
jgi:hypothetical protein